MRKAHTRDSVGALSKLAEVVDGRYRIVSRPPVIIPLRDLAASYEMTAEQARNAVKEQFDAYTATLSNDRRQLLDRFTIVDAARKVVGVGSVGTRAFIVLLQGRDNTDPLFLQVKEATSSVLEDHLPKSRYNTPGQRVVEGQRLLQAASDIFLGWTRRVQANRYFYWRQLRDMKASAEVELMSPFGMTFYARMCGWTLARAHARSGDPIAIAEYLGTDDTLDNAICRLLRPLRRPEPTRLRRLRPSHRRRPNPSRHRDLSPRHALGVAWPARLQVRREKKMRRVL